MFGIEFSHVVIVAFRLIRISDRKMGKKKKEKKRKEILAFTFIKSCVLIILARICTSRSLDLGLVVEQGL
jgi:hypothetical protein